MGSLQSDIPNSQPISRDIQEETNFEDEINLVDYFRVLWKRKHFIVFSSVLPALFVGLIIFLWPRKYTATYIYNVKDRSAYDVKGQRVYDVSNWNLDEKNYTMLLDRFYSAENMDKIVDKLRVNGLNRYAELMSKAKRREDLKKLVGFDVLPAYVDLSKAKVTDPAQLEQIRQLKALLLNMTVTGRPKDDIPKISLVMRDNLENVIPVYFIEEQLNAATRDCRANMATIEENKFGLELELQGKKAALAKLKNIKTGTSDKAEGNVILRFDVGDRSEYLPLGYQIQAAESKIVEIEENLRADEEKYDYYKNLLTLNEKLLAELKQNIPSYYTIQQFHSFLTNLVKDYDEQLIDYLNSYIKKIENRISAGTPVIEKPKVYMIHKGAVKKSAIAFGVCLMISLFAAFLLEGLQKSRVQAS